MKTIGLRRSSLTPEQIEQLGEIVRPFGYEFRAFSPDDEHPAIQDCELLMGQFPAQSLRGARALSWLHLPSAGCEVYLPDALYADPERVTLTNSSGAFGIPIAEYMICGLLMILRRMSMYMDNQRQHLWKQYPGASSLYGSRVTVVGMGDLGGCFAARLHAMGAHVTGVRRAASDIPPHFERQFTVDQIDQAIADADAVALCLPSTPHTIGLMDEARIGRLKPGAILINVGRGSAVDSLALARALQAGHLGGALLDVTDPEPLPADHPLWDCPNVVITPHISGIDRDRLAQSIVFDIYRDNLVRYIEGRPLQNVVDRVRGY